MGVTRDDHPLARAYHRVLVWDIMRKPVITRLADRALNPLIGKSLVVYAAKGEPQAQPAGRRRARHMPSRERPASNSAAACPPEVPGVLTADDILATGRSIAASQQPDGAIGWPDGHVDAWNHVECAMAVSACGLRDAARRAYDWLRATQRPDGSWPRATAAGLVTDHAAESNHAAYPAVGVWHELLVTGDEAFAAAMWPMVRRATDFVLGLQTGRGELAWERTASGAVGGYALLAGSASAYQGLRCAVALAEYVAEPQPGLGTSRRPARARRRLPSGGVRRQEQLLDGLVLPGARRPGPRQRRAGPAGGRLGCLRRTRPGRPLRQRSAVGDRRGDLRAGARAGRGRRPGPGS